jgi:hypothetical protein
MSMTINLPPAKSAGPSASLIRFATGLKAWPRRLRRLRCSFDFTSLRSE